MTVVLIVLGVLILLIAGVLLLRATVTIKYRDEVTLTLRVLFFTIRILPAKEKKPPRLRDYTPAKFRRMLKKKRRKAEKKRLKAKKTAEKKAAKKALKKSPKQMSSHQSSKKRDLLENIELVKALVEVFCKRFAKHLRVTVARLKITVASDEAAKTAYMYGAVSQSVAYLTEVLDRITNLRYTNDAELGVLVDFGEAKPTADIDISVSMRVWQLLDVLLRTGFTFLQKR